MGNKNEVVVQVSHIPPAQDNILLSKKYKYTYANRRCNYRTEQLEISPPEEAEIKRLIADANLNSTGTSETTTDCNENVNKNVNNNNIDIMDQIISLSRIRPLKIIIDTDIGTDIDDVLTLLQLVHMSKEDVECIGITTNYRPTRLRKYIAEQILNATDDPHFSTVNKIPVIAGSCYLCGTHREFYHAGNEGNGLGLTEEETLQLWSNVEEDNDTDNEVQTEVASTAENDDTSNSNSNSNSMSAEDFIFQMLKKYPKQVTIVSIGIPTNIGNLIHKYSASVVDSLIGHLVVMGGGSMVIQRSKTLGSIGVWSDNPKKWKTRHDLNSQQIAAITPLFKLPKDMIHALRWCEEQNAMQKSQQSQPPSTSTTSASTINVLHFFPNHNLSGDTLASVMLFGLRKCPISIIPHHITRKHILKGRAIETLLNLAMKSDIENKIYEDNENGLCGVLLREWFRVRRRQRVQCLHDPLTLYEAVYPTPKEESTEVENDNVNVSGSGDNNTRDRDNEFIFGRSGLRYLRGTFVCHEWAAFLTFFPYVFIIFL